MDPRASIALLAAVFFSCSVGAQNPKTITPTEKKRSVLDKWKVEPGWLKKSARAATPAPPVVKHTVSYMQKDLPENSFFGAKNRLKENEATGGKARFLNKLRGRKSRGTIIPTITQDQAMQAFVYKTPSGLQDVYNRADFNYDGYVHNAELASMLQANLGSYLNMPMVRRGIMQADVNHDGVISYTEFCNGVKAIAPQAYLAPGNMLPASVLAQPPGVVAPAVPAANIPVPIAVGKK